MLVVAYVFVKLLGADVFGDDMPAEAEEEREERARPGQAGEARRAGEHRLTAGDGSGGDDHCRAEKAKAPRLIDVKAAEAPGTGDGCRYSVSR